MINNIKNIGGSYFCQNMPFNPKSLKNLRKLIDKTNGRIILTSSWRLSHDCMVVLEARLAEYGMKIFDKTSKIYDAHNPRGKEIWEWIDIFNLKYNKGDLKDKEAPIHLKDILIIDDEIYDIDRYYNDNYIVKCDPKKGFNKIKYWEALDKYKENLTLDDLWVVDPINNVPVKY